MSGSMQLSSWMVADDREDAKHAIAAQMAATNTSLSKTRDISGLRQPAPVSS
jgi:hypothetical protein